MTATVSRLLRVVAAGCLFAVAGCSGSDPGPSAVVNSPAATSVSATPATSSTGAATSSNPSSAASTSSGPESPFTVHEGYRPASLSADQQAVVEAYNNYWTFRAQSLGTASVDLSKADAVTSAQGLGQITGYTAQQKAQGHHTTGRVTTNILAVTLKDASATVEDCVLNESYDVRNDTGAAVEKPSGLTRINVTLVRPGPRWLVANLGRTDKPCTVPTA